MNGYYKNKIKVVGADLLCFPVNSETLEPLGCGCYDPWAWSDPDPEPLETIGISEWVRRRAEIRQKEESIKKSRDYCVNNFGYGY